MTSATSPSITFVTSFRSRALADDWDRHVWMLEQTIHSMLAQSDAKCDVVIGCHEIPTTRLIEDPRVHFISAQFARPEKNNDAMCVDKVLKLSIGVEWALAQGRDYIVFSDGDDLVSNRIGAFVAAHHGGNGWYSDTLRFHAYGSRFVRFQKYPPPVVSPTLIVRADLLKFSSPRFSVLGRI